MLCHAWDLSSHKLSRDCIGNLLSSISGFELKLKVGYKRVELGKKPFIKIIKILQD